MNLMLKASVWSLDLPPSLALLRRALTDRQGSVPWMCFVHHCQYLRQTWLMCCWRRAPSP